VERGYVVRVDAATAVKWQKWWTDPTSAEMGSVTPDSLAVIEVPIPPDLANAGALSPTMQRVPIKADAPPPGGRPQFLARLAEGSADRFDLAVCTDDGQVLDIGDVAVRWEWPSDEPSLYLVVLPDPWNSGTVGSYRVELSRSAFGSSRP